MQIKQNTVNNHMINKIYARFLKNQALNQDISEYFKQKTSARLPISLSKPTITPRQHIFANVHVSQPH